MKPARGLVLVKPVEADDHLPGGVILIPQPIVDRMTLHQVEVVAVGPPSICETPRKCERRHEWNCKARGSVAFHAVDARLKPGAWVYLRPRSLVDASQDARLYFVRHEDCLAVFTVQDPKD